MLISAVVHHADDDADMRSLLATVSITEWGSG